MYAPCIDIVLDDTLDIGASLQRSHNQPLRQPTGVQMGQLSVELSARVKDLQLQPKPFSERRGVSFPRSFTARLEAGKTPYDEIRWELRPASIGNDKGAGIFQQRGGGGAGAWLQK